jgi:molybdopterin synthase sulfur carrier subunit
MRIAVADLAVAIKLPYTIRMILASYRGSLSWLTGVKEETIPAQTIRDVLDHIAAAYGTAALKAAKAMLITVNGKSCLKMRVFKTQLNDGDTVSFLPVSAGG